MKKNVRLLTMIMAVLVMLSVITGASAVVNADGTWHLDENTSVFTVST